MRREKCRRVECGGPGNRSLRFEECIPPSVTSETLPLQAHMRVESLVIQLSYGQTTSGPLHEHYNLWCRRKVLQSDLWWF